MPASLHERVLLYREAARHLWNTCFAPRATTADVGKLLDAFDRIRPVLFASLTGYELQLAGVAAPIAIDVVVRPHCELMTNRDAEGGSYWDHPLRRTGAHGLRGRFVDFFDWDCLGVRDFAFCMLEITACAERPDVVGRRCLVHVRDVEFA